MSWIVAALIWVALGAVVGFIASKVVGVSLSLIGCVVLGAIGAVLGGLLAGLLGLAYGVFWNFLIAFLGACLVMLVVRMVRK